MKILIEYSIKRGMVVVIFHCGLLFSSFSFSTLYSMEISVAKSNSSISSLQCKISKILLNQGDG